MSPSLRNRDHHAAFRADPGAGYGGAGHVVPAAETPRAAGTMIARLG